MLAGCSLPRFSMPKLYRITVQQGNVITQEMVDKLKPGMTRSQVAYIMGEPILRNTFNENRWDYIYTVVLPGYFEQDVRLSLFFENEVLAYFTGDFAPTPADEETQPTEQATDSEDADEIATS
jgi:outer membrane protein assembly factor BamE